MNGFSDHLAAAAVRTHPHYRKYVYRMTMMMMIRGELAPQPRRNSLLVRTNYSDETTEKENDDGGGTEGRKMEVQTL